MYQDNILGSLSPVQKYLKFSAKPELGRFVLDSRPVWLFSSDGRNLVWANTAGLECFALDNLHKAYGISFDDTTPARRHIAKIATHATPHSKGRVEILRFLIGSKSQSHACVCRPIQVDGAIFVLAVASDLSQTRSFSERTQALLDVILNTDPKAIGALKDSSGHILAVTQKAPPQGMASLALSALSEAIGQEGQTYVESVFNLNGQTLGLAIEFSFDTRLYQLIILTAIETDHAQDYMSSLGAGETDSALLTSTVSSQNNSTSQNEEADYNSPFYGLPNMQTRPAPPAQSENDFHALSRPQPERPAMARPAPAPEPVPPSYHNPEPYPPAPNPSQQGHSRPQNIPAQKQAKSAALPSAMTSRMRERFQQSREKLNLQASVDNTPAQSMSPQTEHHGASVSQPTMQRPAINDSLMDTRPVEPKPVSPVPAPPPAIAPSSSADFKIHDRRAVSPALPVNTPAIEDTKPANTAKETMRQKLQRKLLQKQKPETSTPDQQTPQQDTPTQKLQTPQRTAVLPTASSSMAMQNAHGAAQPLPAAEQPHKAQKLESTKRFSWQTDSDYKIVNFSDTFCQFTGLSETAWKGLTFDQLADLTQCDDFKTLASILHKNEKFSDIKITFLPPDLPPVTLEFSGIALGKGPNAPHSYRGFGKIIPVSENRPKSAPQEPSAKSAFQQDLDKEMSQTTYGHGTLEELDITADHTPGETVAPLDSAHDQTEKPLTDLKPAQNQQVDTTPDAPKTDHTADESPETVDEAPKNLSGDETRNLKAIAERLALIKENKSSSPQPEEDKAQSSETELTSKTAQIQNQAEENAPDKHEAQPPEIAPQIADKPQELKEEKAIDHKPVPTDSPDKDTDKDKIFEANTLEKTILDYTPLALLIHDGSELLYANSMALNLVGAQKLSALQDIHGIYGLIQNEPDKPIFVTKLIRPDGQTLDVIIRRQNINWNDKAVSLFSIREQEISASAKETPYYKMRYEQSLKRIREVEAILDTATDGVAILDEEGKILTLNRSAESLFNIDQHDWIGQDFSLLFSFDDRDLIENYILQTPQNSQSIRMLKDGHEVSGQTSKGEAIALYVACKQITSGDNPKYCAVMRDMRPWKRIENDLITARKNAEDANAHKSDFLARVSHEIRTPLNAIIGFSDIMKEERFGAVGSDRYRGYLRDIHTSGEHLMSLLNDLLDLSKIEAGKLEMDFTSVDLNDIIEQSVAILQDQASRQKIIMRTSLDKDLPKIVADTRSVRQIMLNLLSNAIKFTKSSGHIIVSTSYEESGEAVLRVKDTGIGMSDKEKETAMEPFRQIETLPKNQRANGHNDVHLKGYGTGHDHGTGLGLPLTKALVEANRAEFHLESEKGKGTLIRITFPQQRVLVD
jgi:PAS domain S-box-containing protein